MSPSSLIGKKAPEISLPNASGETFKFTPGSSGRPTVVFFYPKSGSYGCTRQVCQFRDALSEKEIYKTSQVEVIGISPDPVQKQKGFVEKQKVPYPILSDDNGEARKAYGVPRGLFGLVASSRVTFLIDSEGIIRGKLDNTINFAAHAKFVDNWLRHLPKVELTTTTPPEVPKKDASNGVEGKAAPEVPAKEDKPSKAVTEAKSAPEVPEKETRPATTEVSATPAIPEKEAPEKASAPVVEKIAEPTPTAAPVTPPEDTAEPVSEAGVVPTAKEVSSPPEPVAKDEPPASALAEKEVPTPPVAVGSSPTAKVSVPTSNSDAPAPPAKEEPLPPTKDEPTPPTPAKADTPAPPAKEPSYTAQDTTLVAESESAPPPPTKEEPAPPVTDKQVPSIKQEEEQPPTDEPTPPPKNEPTVTKGEAAPPVEADKAGPEASSDDATPVEPVSEKKVEEVDAKPEPEATLATGVAGETKETNGSVTSAIASTDDSKTHEHPSTNGTTPDSEKESVKAPEVESKAEVIIEKPTAELADATEPAANEHANEDAKENVEVKKVEKPAPAPGVNEPNTTEA